MPRSQTIPPLDDLTAVLSTIVSGRSRDAAQVRRESGLDYDRAQAALGELRRRDLAQPMGGGQWSACQRECACCGQRPSGGAEIDFDPETLRWYCAGCWEQEADKVRRLVEGDQEGGE
jgi:hypothetical protein